ncbi:MAG: NADH:flavin oxidoreductase [Gammaproteobacteria bacterium]|nr:NADH:flavin oxidoreductase [Gammaproteobacteria bacterium]
MMARDPKYDILFEPVKIGPVTAPNRFYQVPHCNVLGHGRPHAEAANRRVKAEGGWGVVCTQEVEIHPTSDITPTIEGRLWDDRDIPQHRLMTDAVHEHGALAGIELLHSGFHATNLYSRVAPVAPSPIMAYGNYPGQARGISKREIADLRRWYIGAALRAKKAGYDIIYVYAGHDLSILQHFMKPSYNRRTDEYGGSLENRVRLAKEVLTDTREAVGDQCAVAFRFATEELLGADGLQVSGESQDIVGMLAEIPDLWDVNISDWSNDSSSARFEPNEGYQEPYTAFVKSMTSKPVVGVGRFTSADTMVSQIKRGVLDLIGAARPSIADPFLPRKIDQGRIEDIRECIGCNICVAQDNMVAPIRCTQNPTQGEEWKQGWHPESIEAAASDDAVLVVGAGPAGLECALQLANRGYPVALAEASEMLGGRVLHESSLPGMSSYLRVRDYRESQLRGKENVEIYLDNKLGAQDIIDLEIPHVIIATGAHWRRDGVGRTHLRAIDGIDKVEVFTPDDVFAGTDISGRVLIYDDDYYYLGSTLAELFRNRGQEVCLLTPESKVSIWTEYTLEQAKVQSRLIDLDVEILVSHRITSLEANTAHLEGAHRQRLKSNFDSIIMITSRDVDDALYQTLLESEDRFRTLRAIGDCHTPGTVAAAVYDGHAAARQLDSGEDIFAPLFRRDLPAID